jgi:hypothetical protein
MRNRMPRQNFYVGVDPGAGGGIAILHSQGIVRVEKMPATERDIWDLFVWARVKAGQSQQVKGIIEKVGAMPKQGLSSTFKFGVGYGGLRMALIASLIPFEAVTPIVWQRGLHILPRKKEESKTKFKNRLKSKAQQLFPELKVTLATADALLIAEYCRRFYEGRL